jgi:hypothetical protein
MDDSDNVDTVFTFLCVHSFNISRFVQKKVLIYHVPLAALAFEDMLSWMHEGGQVS